MTSTVDIRFPAIYTDLVSAEDSIVCVEHASLDCRMLQVLLALAFARSVEGKSIGVATSKVAKARFVMSTWTGVKTKTFGVATLVESNMNKLWLIDTSSGTIINEQLPFTKLDDLYVVESNELKGRPLIQVEGQSIYCGTLSFNGHWFYDLARKSKTLRFDMEAILKAFPDQWPYRLEKTDPYYERNMLLMDVNPRLSTMSFIRFANERLKIKTDKPRALLNPRQQEEAALQSHGAPIVSFQVSALQRRYEAMKRLAVAKGKKPYFLLLKYRRGGFTTLEQGKSYQMTQVVPGSAVASLAHTKESMTRIFRIAKLYAEKDPKGLKLVGDSKNSLEFTNGSLFFIGTAGGDGFGRGDTLQRVHGSEVSKWCRGPNQMEDVDDLVAGLLGAASNGEVVFETTPDGREWFCQEYELAKKGQSEFTPIFLRWFDDPLNRNLTFFEEELRDTLTDEERALIQRHGLDLSQIAFRRDAKKRYKRLFAQEMPEDDVSCFISSGVCFFDTEHLLSLLASLPMDAGRRIQHPGGVEIRWKEPKPNGKYAMGVDTSEGLPGCDPCGWAILDRETGEQVAALHGYFNPTALANSIKKTIEEYRDIIVGIERQHPGPACIQKVMELGVSKPHFRGGPLYFHHQGGKIDTSRPGWSTDGNTRSIMLEDLAEAIREGSMKINDVDFINEALSFRLQSSGKFEADSGAHDDVVIKWAIALQMRKAFKPAPRIAFSDGT